MGALKIAVYALFLALVGPGVQAGAWKCQIDGKTVFSDVPCPGQGKVIDTTSGQNRGFSGPRQEMLREQARERQVQAEAARAQAARSRALQQADRERRLEAAAERGAKKGAEVPGRKAPRPGLENCRVTSLGVIVCLDD